MSGIVDGNSKSLPFGNLPNMGDALENWYQTMTVSIVTKSLTNYQVVESLNTFSIQAVRQPMSSRDLQIKPEGQRAWNWETLHVKGDDVFNVDDIVLFNNKEHRIMQKWNWSEYNYNEYHMVEAFYVAP